MIYNVGTVEDEGLHDDTPVKEMYSNRWQHVKVMEDSDQEALMLC